MGIWDFAGKTTADLTHHLHNYPARLNPNVARRLIKLYGKNAQNLLDPFCGSGTTLVEGRVAGLDVFGFDINPSARLMSEVKSSDFDLETLDGLCKQLSGGLLNPELVGLDEAVQSSNLSENKMTWFPKQTIKEISTVLKLIEDSDFETNYKDFARVILSDCLRWVANQRMGEWKLYRESGYLAGDIKKGSQIEEIYRPLFPLFMQKLSQGKRGMNDFSERIAESKRATKSVVLDVNSVTSGRFPHLPDEGVDLVVTSPPYGDSVTTVAYGQFSWFSNVWLGLDTRQYQSRLDSEMMGGKPDQSWEIESFGCKEIDIAIGKMDDDMKRKNYVFYHEYLQSIRNVAKNVKKGGLACFVVGNRTSGGQYLRLDLFTKWAFEQCGFSSREIKKRRLTNTRMPGKISFESSSGKKTVSTMSEEFIVVCKKN
jgi:tRNA G10  N-methylase Trm11